MIELIHVKKAYEQICPLTDINAQIHKGDVIAVIGHSGCGKSSLIRMINLLEKPTSGKIIVDGVDITAQDYKSNEICRKVGMVFQNFNLFPHLTVVENVMIPQIDILKKSRQEAYDEAVQLLEMVGMDNFAMHYPGKLSGGQKQRVAIARTLALKPEIILFDEPTSALDPTMVGEVQNVIGKLADLGHTMMIVSHELKFVRNVANRVFYLDQGVIYEEGTPEQIFDNPQKERTYQFIHSLSYIDMLVKEDTHDLSAEIGKIYAFCSSKGLKSKRTMNVCAAYEEYLNILYRYSFGNIRTVRVTVEYESSSDKLFLAFTPYSMKNWNEISSILTESIEYKMFTYYLKGYSEEKIQSEDGIGIRYTYEL